VSSRSVDCYATKDLNSCDFFEKYVFTRQPVKFIGHITDPNWKAEQWSNEYLQQKVGDATVKVEYRDGTHDRFGKGTEKIMRFGDVIDSIKSGDENLYLTTQKLNYTIEGQPFVLSQPMLGLREDIPIRPTLMGNLITQNINMWMGSTSIPTTSGLHHDFHDNLYIILRGTKTLTLFPPTEYKNLYLVGDVLRLHDNGRINYTGQPTRADGSCIGSDEAMQAAKRLAEAERRLENEESGAESDVEEALQALLDAQTAENEDDGLCSDDEDSAEEDGFSESEDGDEQACKRRRRMSGSEKDEEEEEEALSLDDPPNFSRVDTSLDADELNRLYPLYVEARDRAAVTVTLKAGEMLYMPAGWFHEVKSQGPAPLGHMAVNYWFHPPDGSSYEKPYTSEFWENDWKSRNIEQ